ncbi:HAD-IA family hydrolase [Streptomyces olivaceoviridis]|uniref:HAD-IA family hydrolase n=1 Tax=Streptomyces olivaceoviridis TaxID=1921 RepID=UPI00379A2690
MSRPEPRATVARPKRRSGTPATPGSAASSTDGTPSTVRRATPAAPNPPPGLYREALARLGVAPYEAVAFEDSPSGIRAARTAGVRCVAVPNTMTAQGATPADHDDPGGRRDVRPAGRLFTDAL